MLSQNLAPALAALQLQPAQLVQQLAAHEAAILALHQRISAHQLPAFSSGPTGALQLPPASVQAVQGWATRFQHVLVLGLGGSSLGGRLVQQFANPAQLGRAEVPTQPPRLHFLDHLCPHALGQLCAQLPLAHTAVIAISKSGSTLETTTQLEVLAAAYQAAKVPLAPAMVVVTEPTANPLNQWASAHGVTSLPHHPQLGGRYSIFGPTGTLPGLIVGLNVAAWQAGAAAVLNDFLANPLTCAPAQGAALHALALQQGKTMHVMYAYGEPLRIVPAWFEQLWAESLGKSGHGTTPLGASGPAAQHSIQQLFLAGPSDKLYTLVLPTTHGPQARSGPVRPSDSIALGTLQQAMGQGTVAALVARQQPVRVLTLPPQLSPQQPAALGALLMHCMLETVLTAQLWGVDPFNQPAVEESKQASLAALAALQ